MEQVFDTQPLASLLQRFLSCLSQVCDSAMRIAFFEPRFTGSCNDIYMWQNALLRMLLMAACIVVDDEEFLLGK